MDKETLRRLVSHYKGSVPRYTSYPTAVEFTEAFKTSDWQKVLSSKKHLFTDGEGDEKNSDEPFSLYIHIPFCKKLCFFCACNKLITNDYSVVKPYSEALLKEAGHYKESFGERPLRQFHLGGGTPNYLRPSDLGTLLAELKKRFGPKSNDSDYSMEVDPRTTLEAHLLEAREQGFNRISMGIQDFDPVVQSTINRVQPEEETRKLIEAARQAGFGGVNVDLIYGLPNQTEQGFANTLKAIKEIKPNRIALYGYAHVTWLQKVQKSFHRAHLPSPEERAELFLLAVEELLEAGYRYIGLDHFALPDDKLSRAQQDGSLNRNFMGYTTHKDVDILGLGASAISTTRTAFAQNHKDLSTYHSDMTKIHRGYWRTKEDYKRGEIIEQILCNGVVDLSDYEGDWERELKEVSSQPKEVLGVSDEKITLTQTGRLFSRNIASIFDEHLAKHRGAKKFSQAV